MDLKRINVSITQKQFEYLSLKARNKGIAFSEMLRRILDTMVDSKAHTEPHEQTVRPIKPAPAQSDDDTPEVESKENLF